MGTIGKKILFSALLVVFGVASAAFLPLLLSLFGVTVKDETEAFLSGFFGGSIPFLILAVVVFTPVLEELLFRKLLYGGLRKKLPVWAALLLSSFVFALLHFQTAGILSALVQMLFAFLLGCALAFIMEKSGSWIASVILHASVNAAGLAVNESPALRQFLDVNRIPCFISAVAVLVLSGLLLFFSEDGLFRKTRPES